MGSIPAPPLHEYRPDTPLSQRLFSCQFLVSMLFFMLLVRVVPIMRTLEERSLRTELTRVPCIYSIEFRRKRSVYLVSHTLKKYALSRD